ncbi:MAG: hypothetical protein Ta2D_07170 [Rickettsiales bacterium]|nr:MAG: hypothetical protein Ta2D_07170 [Rickettsiales bacterium]
MVVNNDHLVFKNLKDVKNYAKEHKIFDSKGTELFYDAHIRNLGNEGFNEQYFLNQRYNGKTPLELANERANYVAGIDRLLSEETITEKEANAAKNELTKVLDNENDAYSRFMTAYYADLVRSDNKLLKTENGKEELKNKLNTIALNQKMVQYTIEQKLEKHGLRNLGVSEVSGKLQDDAFERNREVLLSSVLKENNVNTDFEAALQTRKEQNFKEGCIVNEFSDKNKDLMNWLDGMKAEVEKNTKNVSSPEKKKQIEAKVLASYPASQSEANKLKKFENQCYGEIKEIKEEMKNDSKIKELKEELSNVGFWKFAVKRALKKEIEAKETNYNNKIKDKEEYFKERKADLQLEIKQNRADLYKEYVELPQQKIEKQKAATASMVRQDNVSFAAKNVAENLLKAVNSQLPQERGNQV